MAPNWIKLGVTGMKAFITRRPVVFLSIMIWIVFICGMLVIAPSATLAVLLLVLLFLTASVILHWVLDRIV